MATISMLNILPGIPGTQEIIILVIIAIPVVIIVQVPKFIKRRDVQNRNTGVSTADEIEKLFALKQKGVISQLEFDNKKAALLK